MKKIFIPSLLLLITLFFVSCQLGNKGPAYTLKMRLAEGDHFEQNIKSDMIMTSGSGTSSINMKMGSDIACFFDVIKSSPEETQLRMTYSRSKTTTDMGSLGKGINTDSILEKQNSKLIGKSITILLSKDNEIKNVVGIENILGTDSAADDRTKQLLRKMFSKEQVTSLFGQMFNMYPKDSVRIGDSWNGESSLNISALKVGIKLKYTLASVQNGLATVEMAGTIDGKRNSDISHREIDMSGSEHGVVTIKLADGYLQEGKYTMNITASMEKEGKKNIMSIKGAYTIYGK